MMTELYRFRVGRKWYAYLLEWQAVEARQYFLDYGYDPSIISEIEKSDERDFQYRIHTVGGYQYCGVI